MRILIVKTSSMGDVVHALPAVSDLVACCPDAQVEWLVEKSFAAIPALHQGVQKVWPLMWRRWRKNLGHHQTWREMGQLRQGLRVDAFDAVLDLQGLLKSALWGLQAKGPLWGFGRHSIREPLASLFYQRSARVSCQLHAVDRCRALVAQLLGYELPSTPPDFGLQARASALPLHESLGGSIVELGRSYAVLIPCASRVEKLWPEDRWVGVGRELRSRGHEVVVVWGSEPERERAQRIAQACEARVPVFLSVEQAGAVLSRASFVVGLDTGMTHLGAALGVSTVGIYCDFEPGLAGVRGSGFVASVGGRGQSPSLQSVMDLLGDKPSLLIHPH